MSEKVQKSSESNEDLDNRITIELENGKTVEGEILFEFEENGDDFVAYVIDETIYVAKYDEDGKLFPIAEDEWTLVEKIVNSFLEDMEEEEEE